MAKTEGIKATAHEKSGILLEDVAAADQTSAPPKLGTCPGCEPLMALHCLKPVSAVMIRVDKSAVSRVRMV